MQLFKHKPHCNCAIFGDGLYSPDQPTSLKESYHILRRLPNLRAIQALIFMTAAMVGVVLIGNLAALKIWSLAGWPVDGGFWIFPFSYIIGDLLMEIYGRKISDWVAWFSTGCCLGLVAILHLVGLLPRYPGADISAFVVTNAALGRIFTASVAGFLASQLLNNFIFEQVSQKHEQDSFWRRALISSALAHVADVLVFEPMAFLGMLSLGEFFKQAVLAYAMGVLVEFAMVALLTRWLAPKLVRKLDFQHGERISLRDTEETTLSPTNGAEP